VVLFDSDPQYREKATIWRIFSMFPLYGALPSGHIWRWFAINIPMDLGTGGKFTGDIDILARLYDFPRSRNWFYETWEVKVSLLCKNGRIRSLKSGKMGKMMGQLKAYREFGSPSVSLLDTYICEAGFMANNTFPPASIERVIRDRLGKLYKEGFGYQLLPFEHSKDGNADVGLKVYSNRSNPLETRIKMLAARESCPRELFSHLAGHINDFFEDALIKVKKPVFNQILFCRNCRCLQLIRMKETSRCPTCQKDLILQS
jgi:hypothetical protein